MQQPPGWGRENRETIFTVYIHGYFEGQRALYMILAFFSYLDFTYLVWGVQPASVCIGGETHEKVFSIVMTRAIFLKMNTIFCSNNYSIHGFPYNLLPVSCDDIGSEAKKHRSIICLHIRPQSAFTVLRAALPSANYFAITIRSRY